MRVESWSRSETGKVRESNQDAIGCFPERGLFVVAVLGAGLLCGAINGATSILGRIHPIVVTLGTLTIYRGLVIQLTGSGVISGLPDSFGQLATSSFLGLSGSVWILLATLAVGHFIIAHSVWGREILAVGSSPSAARLAGISCLRSRLSRWVLRASGRW